MTKDQAVAKVTKLRSLAQGTGNEHERQAATDRAAALMAEHHLKEEDLVPEAPPLPASSHPFDQFVEKVRKYTLKNHGAGDLLGHPLLMDVLEQAREDLTPESKDRLLNKVGSIVKLSSIFGLTKNKTMRDIANIYDVVTKNKK